MWCFPARCLANVFLEFAERDGSPIIAQRLHRLLYIAHGLSLAKGQGRLVSEQFVAWPEGPILIDLFDHLLDHGSNFLPLNSRVKQFDPDLGTYAASPLPNNQGLMDFLRDVHELCRPYPTPKLNGLTLEANGANAITSVLMSQSPTGHRLIDDKIIESEFVPYSFASIISATSIPSTMH